jgi:hypothetical protein
MLLAPAGTASLYTVQLYLPSIIDSIAQPRHQVSVLSDKEASHFNDSS